MMGNGIRGGGSNSTSGLALMDCTLILKVEVFAAVMRVVPQERVVGRRKGGVKKKEEYLASHTRYFLHSRESPLAYGSFLNILMPSSTV